MIQWNISGIEHGVSHSACTSILLWLRAVMQFLMFIHFLTVGQSKIREGR